MAKLSVFNLVTLDGYFTGENGDISWHNVDKEFGELAEKNSNSGNTLLFGRVTYELMAGYWPTAEAKRDDPVVAEGMNKSYKIVFSRTLDRADWNNTRLVKENMVEEVRKLKRESGNELTLLGSGNIISQLTQQRLIDEYQILLIPVALGRGRTMFEGIKDRIFLRLLNTRTFGNGNILLIYAPA